MIEVCIGGDGITAPRLTAVSLADRVAMVDRYLAEHDNEVMYLEIKRDERSWEDWMSNRRPIGFIQFMRVGVTGDRAAAEYVYNSLTSASHVIHATFNAKPPLAKACVPYGYDRYFPPETVISLAEVRQLMIDFVTTGEWSHVTLWRDHENLVA
ncbi:MAG TPA: Imm1 family immunity protein [Pseudonocardiaceae bacterium]|jgi:hypothetical protein|nr:Imm1 family immunity protein [Pseudonocardiaceae bacterium]